MPHSVLGLTMFDISVINSGIVTVFLARGRSKHIEMFGDLALHCLLLVIHLRQRNLWTFCR